MQKKHEIRRNIKLPNDVFIKLKALNNVKNHYMQYQLIDLILDQAISNLSSKEKEFYDFQLKQLKE